jgi:tRNA pseudouridine38-40 synthase
MPHFKLTLEYDGTKFCGWQIQQKNVRTVQGELKHALDIICKEPITVIGAGRTDSGVHALGQVAHFKTHTSISPKILLRALNANLPDDVAVLKVQCAKTNFHAQYCAKSKIYRYTILNQQTRRVKRRGFYHQVHHKLNDRLMKSEAKVLIGRHDFRAFVASDPQLKKKNKIKNTIRNIKNISIKKSHEFLHINIEANGFLYKMVRNIVGTLIQIGLGKISKGELKKSLRSKCRKNAGPTAPAQGLCLLKVKY